MKVVKLVATTLVSGQNPRIEMNKELTSSGFTRPLNNESPLRCFPGPRRMA